MYLSKISIQDSLPVKPMSTLRIACYAAVMMMSHLPVHVPYEQTLHQPLTSLCELQTWIFIGHHLAGKTANQISRCFCVTALCGFIGLLALWAFGYYNHILCKTAIFLFLFFCLAALNFVAYSSSSLILLLNHIPLYIGASDYLYQL